MGVPGSSNQPIYGTIKKQTNPVSLINLGCWNIRRGLVKRELEIIDLINSNNLAVLFLVETDSHLINEKKDFGINGFETAFHKKRQSNEKTRMICLFKTKVNSTQIKLREDLMSNSFPSIWLETTNEQNQSRLICGFYREWSNEGLLSTEAQVAAIKILTNQIENADLEKKSIIVMGDANVCASKWNESNFKHKNVAEEIKGSKTDLLVKR